LGLSVAVITLGCPKNEVDSEFIKGELSHSGFNLVSDIQEAHIIVINTCGFIEPAKCESIETIIECTRCKRGEKCQLLAVVGCLAQRYFNELSKEIPEIDLLLGVNCALKLPEKIEEVLRGKRVIDVKKPSINPSELLTRMKPETPSAYLKISDGCNNRCSYCAIPFIRGSYRSHHLGSLVNEVNFLVQAGVREITFVGQDISNYGIDIYDKRKLPELISKLSAIEGLDWMRLLYVQPDGISDELLIALANNPKVCNYIDVPFQHASEKILRMMRRGGSAGNYLSLLDKIRNHVPNIAIRTSLMVGFPGETDEDFEELAEFVQAGLFDYLGVFKYSAEEGTEANAFASQVADEVKGERYHQLISLQDSLAFERNKRYRGKRMKVLVESIDGEKNFSGRNQYQAFEIDGIVYFEGRNLKIGDFVEVIITAVDGYDLIGEMLC